jgi:hypothetical protein
MSPPRHLLSEYIDRYANSHISFSQECTKSAHPILMSVLTTPKYNQVGFLKAFSDDAEGLGRGFGKLPSVLRALHLKKVYLWPRFRVEVAAALSPISPQYEVKVEELSIALTPKMKIIQVNVC